MAHFLCSLIRTESIAIDENHSEAIVKEWKNLSGIFDFVL